MPRGRLLKTKVREAREIAKATVIGQMKGEMQVDKVRFNLNNIGLEIKKRLLEADPSDLSKQVAILGVTVMIHNGIAWTRDLLEAGAWASQFALTFMLPKFLGGKGLFELGLPERKEDQEANLGDEVLAWLISYGLAYLIVEHFDAIVTAIGAGLSSIANIAKSLLGASLVPV